MIKKLYYILGILLVTTTTCYARIIKTDNFEIIHQALLKADKNTLVIFDVDDVILEQRDQIIRTPYKAHTIAFETQLATRYSHEQLKNLRSVVLLAQEPQLVDSKILDSFAFLQAQQIPTVALTLCATGQQGKIASIEDWRIEKLKYLGIDFTTLNKFNDRLLPEIISKQGIVTVKGGIIFTALAEKGIVLDAVLKQEKFIPKKIIFIDDKLKNLQSVQTAALRKDIHFLGFEYTAVKSRKYAPFDLKRNKLQIELLEKDNVWLSDKEALALLQ